MQPTKSGTQILAHGVAFLATSLALVVGSLACSSPAPAPTDTTTDDTTATTAADVVAATPDAPDTTAPPKSREIPATPAFPYGTTCANDADCDGGSCDLSFPGGYCTTACGPSENGALCLHGGVCVPRHDDGKTTWLCARTCSVATDCRTKDGYTCARDHTCWPKAKLIPSNGGTIGKPCWTDSQCASKKCQRPENRDKPTGYAGGYCLQLDCKNKPCPGGAKCLNLTNGSSACFLNCKADADCRRGYRCNGGGCVPGCDKDSDCPDKHVCQEKRCVSAFFGCSPTHPAGYCPSGHHCAAGVCAKGSLACQKPDQYEPNDTPDEAVALEVERTFGGELCPGDSDWFSIDVPAGVLTEVTLNFSHPAGDLDLLVHSDEGTFVRSRWIAYPYKGKLWADFDKSDESVAFYDPLNPRKYRLKVVGSSPSVANTYGIVARYFPYTDAAKCTDDHGSGDCKGLPDGVLRLIHWPEPIPGDKGASGAYKFMTVSGYKWGRRELIMLVREALRRTRLSFPNSGPVAFADTCQRDGVTPGYDIGKPRHCHTCHDQGGNIDIAYFQKNNDHSTRPICGPDNKHYNDTKKECMNGALNEHIVDLDQQVVFMAALFDNPRMRAIGVDPVIGKLLKAKATELHNAGVISDAGNKGIQTKLGLWATHHDHIHVSMQWW